MTQGVGNEPRDSLKRNYRGCYIRVIPSFLAEHQQVLEGPTYKRQTYIYSPVGHRVLDHTVVTADVVLGVCRCPLLWDLTSIFFRVSAAERSARMSKLC